MEFGRGVGLPPERLIDAVLQLGDASGAVVCLAIAVRRRLRLVDRAGDVRALEPAEPRTAARMSTNIDNTNMIDKSTKAGFLHQFGIWAIV
jgi:hypothetical protein